MKDGSFNTVDVSTVTDTLIDHVTLTGDCQTGHAGGHPATFGRLRTSRSPVRVQGSRSIIGIANVERGGLG